MAQVPLESMNPRRHDLFPVRAEKRAGRFRFAFAAHGQVPRT
jgi:hypothetical protein